MNTQWIKKAQKGLTDIWNVVWSAEDIQQPLTRKKNTKYNLRDNQFPSFAELLPYRYFDSNSGLFFNKNSCGLLYQILPLTGANETVAEMLDDILRNKVTDEFNLQVIWVKHNQVGHMVDAFASQFNDKDFTHLNKIGDKLKEWSIQ